MLSLLVVDRSTVCATVILAAVLSFVGVHVSGGGLVAIGVSVAVAVVAAPQGS